MMVVMPFGARLDEWGFVDKLRYKLVGVMSYHAQGLQVDGR